MIRFDIPEAGTVKLTFFDQSGKQVHVIEKVYESGSHSISVSKKELSTFGVLYYRLDIGNYSATKKMISIE